MTRQKSFSVLIAACLLFAPAAAAQSAEETATKMFESAVASPTVPGISVAVAGREGIIWARGFGYADIEHQVPMSTKTKMRIGSVAKPMAAAGLMRLYEQGKVDMDADVRTYVPSWPEKHAVITLNHLTSHRSGIRHYEGDEFLINKPYASSAESLAIFSSSPLLYTPGDKSTYSTHAWTLVAAAMEGADGARDFAAIMEEEVFKPLGMMDSALDDQYKIIPNRQRPYEIRAGMLINAPQTDHSWKWAGGGIIASTSDVARFAVAHTMDGFLKSETRKLMFTPQKLNDGSRVDFGVSWIVGFGNNLTRYKDHPTAPAMMERHKNAVMHSGGSMGGVTMMILCLDHNRAVTVVKNVSSERSANMFLLALQTLDTFYQD